MVTTSFSYQQITKDLTKSLDQVKKQPDVAREATYYLSKIRNLKTIDEFVGDTRAFNFAMKAFGLEDLSYAKAFMKKALTEGIETSDTFANKLSDKRYRDFVETFNYASFGPITSTFESVGQEVVDRYVRQTLESNAGASNEGVRLALYFERKAPTITSAFGILADPALTKVIQTAFQIPAATSRTNIDRQADLINTKLKIADLKDPKKVAALLKRFTSLYELDNPSQSSAGSTASALFSNSSRGVSFSVLQSIQKLRLGGS